MVFNFRTYSSSSESVQDDPTPPRSFSLEEGSFSLAEIRAATDNFSHDNLLADGANFKVYQGRLADGSRVAVKRACCDQRGEEQFEAEMQVRSMVSRHPNVLCLWGFCRTEKELLLVYPLMINNSLYYHLRKRPDRFARPLDWTTRKQIALGAARGLPHLHNQGSIKILHRNICPSNILLNVHFEAVIGGSSLAVIMHEGNMKKETIKGGLSSPWARKLLSRSTTYHPSVFQRYHHYEDVYVETRDCRRSLFVAPEYVRTGKCTLKNDIYAYGRMLLDLISGEPISGPYLLPQNEYVDLCELIGDSPYEDMSVGVIDPNLRGNYVKEEAELLLRLALLCSDEEPCIRPEMSEVVRLLESQFQQRDTSTRSSWSQSERDLTLHYSFFENKKQKTLHYSLQGDSTPYYSLPPSPSSHLGTAT